MLPENTSARFESRTEADQEQESDDNVSTLSITHWEGPYPPPSVLEAYGDILPGAPRQLMDEFLEESRHRRGRELASDQRRSERIAHERDELAQARLGRYLGFIVAMTAIIAALILGLLGQPWLGGVLGGGAVLTVAIALIRGRPGA